MDFKKLAIVSLVGGLIYFFGGWIIYDMILGSFFEGHVGTAQGVAKEVPDLWAVALGSLTAGLLLAYIFLQWAGIKTAATGAKAGALIGFLYALSFDFTQYGLSNLFDIVALFADPIVYAVVSGLAGAAIGWVLGRGEVAS